MQKSKVKLILDVDPNEKGDKENINTNDERHENIVVSEVRKKSLKEIPNGTDKLIDCGTKYDTRKRYSIGNGELRVSGKTREISPTARLAQNRKLSADMRLRSGAYNAADEYVSRRPVRLKCIMNNLEVYDTLHTKADNVSIPHNQYSSFELYNNKLTTISENNWCEAVNKWLNLIVSIIFRTQQQPSSSPLSCTRSICMGSIVQGGNFPVMTTERRKPELVSEYAKDFLTQYFTSMRR